MALPEGIETCTVTSGVPVTFGGAAVKAFVSVEPSVYLVHTATGTPLVDFLEEQSVTEGVAAQFTLPVDQDGFQDENGNAYRGWYYTARITYSTTSKAKNKTPKVKVFQLVSGQTLVDLDTLPGGVAALPYTAPLAAVTSVFGQTGAVALPARLEETALNATFAPAQRLPLRRFHAMLGNRSAVPAQIVCIGDSITEGLFGGSIANRWQTVMLKRLRATLGVTTGNTFPFIPAYPATTSPNDWPVTRTGNVGSNASGGIGLRSAFMTDNTAKLTFTFNGTGAKVMYQQGPAGVYGVMKVTVDGGTPMTTVTSTGSTYVNGKTFDLGTLVAGDHTVVVEWDATTTQRFLVEGLLTYNADKTSGIRVLDAGRYAYSTANFSTMATNHAASVMGAGPIGLAIIALGTNDISGGIPAATYKANLTTMVTALRAAGFVGSILYLMYPKPGAQTAEAWATYLAAVNELAATDPDASVCDLTDRAPAHHPTEPNAASLGLYQDSVHLTAAGNGYFADIIGGRILP